jgi:hypothetical protein
LSQDALDNVDRSRKRKVANGVSGGGIVTRATRKRLRQKIAGIFSGRCRFRPASFVVMVEAERASEPNPSRRPNMRFMCIVKATEMSEKGTLPDQKMLAEMGKFNEEMARAGVMLAGEGLQPSSKGARVQFSGNKRTVVDGPFSETKELIAGFWIIQVKSKEEAVEWIKRCPNPHPGLETAIEIRQIFENEDFGAELTPELRAQEDRIRRDIERKNR